MVVQRAYLLDPQVLSTQPRPQMAEPDLRTLQLRTYTFVQGLKTRKPLPVTNADTTRKTSIPP
jgi:hypothetical protein